MYIERQRYIDDSLIITKLHGESPCPSHHSYLLIHHQEGLPWNYHLREFKDTEPSATVTPYSFDSMAVSCGKSRIKSDSHLGAEAFISLTTARLFDWSLANYQASVELDLPQGAMIKSVRFVNELFETLVVFAEISAMVIYPQSRLR